MTAATGLPDGLKEQSHSLLPGISLDFLKLPKASSGHNISLDFLKLPKAHLGHNFLQVHVDLLTGSVWLVQTFKSATLEVVACNFVNLVFTRRWPPLYHCVQ